MTHCELPYLSAAAAHHRLGEAVEARVAHSPEVALAGNSEEVVARRIRSGAAEEESVGTRSRTGEVGARRIQRCMEAEVKDSDTAYVC